MVKSAVSAAILAAAALSALAEGEYDFRKRLEIVHQAGRRDADAKRAADEFEFVCGAAIVPVGGEPSMEYCGGPEQIRWKLGLMERLYGRTDLQGGTF